MLLHIGATCITFSAASQQGTLPKKLELANGSTELNSTRVKLEGQSGLIKRFIYRGISYHRGIMPGRVTV